MCSSFAFTEPNPFPRDPFDYNAILMYAATSLWIFLMSSAGCEGNVRETFKKSCRSITEWMQRLSLANVSDVDIWVQFYEFYLFK